jgi:hypothetical protein
MIIVGYPIGSYKCLLYWWLSVIIFMVTIVSYYISGYWWLLVTILMVIVIGYSIVFIGGY